MTPPSRYCIQANTVLEALGGTRPVRLHSCLHLLTPTVISAHYATLLITWRRCRVAINPSSTLPLAQSFHNHSTLMPSATTSLTDPINVLPPEIWQTILAAASNGSMEAVLLLTTVSVAWFRAVTASPLLWGTMQFDGSDEDSLATIALFLHLSAKRPLLLQVAVPLSPQFDHLCEMLGPHQDRIRELVLQPIKWACDPDCQSTHIVSDREYLSTLGYITTRLGFLPSLKTLDVVSDRPIQTGLHWTPPSTVSSTGNWLLPLAKLDQIPAKIRSWGHLTIHASDLEGAGSQLAKIERIEYLAVYSNEADYARPQPEPEKNPVDFVVPQLRSLDYHGQMNWASVRLIMGACHTMQHLNLHVSIHDLDTVVTVLKHANALRSFKLVIIALNSALAVRPRQPVHLPMTIQNWSSRISSFSPQNGDFNCEMPAVSDERSLELLWECFHHAFPVANSLLYNPQIEFGTVRVLLRDEFQLQSVSPSAVSPIEIEEVHKARELHCSASEDGRLSESLASLRIPGPITEKRVAEAMIIEAMASIRRSRIPLSTKYVEVIHGKLVTHDDPF